MKIYFQRMLFGSSKLAGNVDIQKRKDANIIYNQFSDYILDKTAFTTKGFKESSRRRRSADA